jgi:fucose permease
LEKRYDLKKKLLLAVIYAAFISLGLPDTTFGVAWSSIRKSFMLPVEAAGIFAIISTMGTTISSFSSGFIIKRLGTGKLVFISCVLTGTALLGFSFANSYVWFILLTIPLGLGAGAVDTSLNNYVAKNYSSTHMSWLHCFWGIGAFAGPNIMTMIIAYFNDWKAGYMTIGLIQLSISVLLFLSLPLWKMNESKPEDGGTEPHPELKGIKLLKKKGVLLSILAFPIYVSIEGGMGLWLGTYLIEGRSLPQINAGVTVSVFYACITIGRFVNGILARYLSDRTLIRMGICTMCSGILLLNLPVNFILVIAVILLGLGCAPVYPAMIHATPKLFGQNNSIAVTGYQIGMANVSFITLVPLIGLLAGRISMTVIPVCFAVSAALFIVITEVLNIKTRVNLPE